MTPPCPARGAARNAARARDTELSLPRLLRLRHFHRLSGLLPFPEPAADVRDGLHAHAMRGLRRQRGTPAARAKEHERLILGEHRFMVRAFRVDPELQHAARTRERSRHLALTGLLAWIANIDEHDIVAAVQF